MACDSSLSFRYPETCNFACDRGYELTTNSSERHCQTDATWSGKDAVCVGVQCPALSTPTNGTMSCINGSSFRHPETCVPCRDLPSPSNGRMTCDAGRSFRHPENCSFSCDSGYELTPTSSRERHCQADSTWSGNDAECIGVQCPVLSTPVNGRISCNTSFSFRHPETCTFTCNHGYLMSAGTSSRTCEADGTWTGSDVACSGVQCPVLSTPTNGRMSCNSGSSFRHPETCTFICNQGYLISAGTRSRTCEADGTWTGSDVACSAFAVGTVCNSGRDLFFVLDGSGSVGAANFIEVKRFVLNVVSAFTIGPTATRVGVVQYSSSNTMEFNLDDHTTAASMIDAINAIRYQGGGTQTGAALGYVHRNAAWRSTSDPKVRTI
ncbi:P-selectin-like [Branchiostoma floridae x Branchiostoma japonicum]